MSRKYFTLIDCTQCGNCCRSLHVEFKKSELHVIAKTLGHSIETFQKKYMSEGNVNPPCPMLNGRLCSIYENRPDVFLMTHFSLRGSLSANARLDSCTIRWSSFSMPISALQRTDDGSNHAFMICQSIFFLQTLSVTRACSYHAVASTNAIKECSVGRAVAVVKNGLVVRSVLSCSGATSVIS